jgi:hypothetical protein
MGVVAVSSADRPKQSAPPNSVQIPGDSFGAASDKHYSEDADVAFAGRPRKGRRALASANHQTDTTFARRPTPRHSAPE